MKPDSVARFEAMIKRAKQIPYSGRPEHKGLVLKDELIAVIEAGLVPPEAESKKETIEIDRAVAEEWAEHCNDTLILNKDMAAEVRKALAGRKGIE